MSFKRKTVNILGASGSIGQNTADVVAFAPDRFDVNIITAHHNIEALQALDRLLAANHAIALGEPEGDARFEDEITKPVDITVSAITGFAGLRPLLQAIAHSKTVAIANKEPLVAAGHLVLEACRKHGTTILPLDSEHNAIFQVFEEENRAAIDRVILTASGGPFLDWPLEAIKRATPEQAVKHPNWSMGRKISVDSASMMNKALEMIEAHFLFNLPADKIDVLIHPQSIVHSMVEYADGSVLAQMGASDMRTPIAYALAWPDRMPTPGQRLDLKALSCLTFQDVDRGKFRAVDLAYDCIKAGQSACIALNAANEAAVDAFLNGQIAFPDIVNCVEHCLHGIDNRSFPALDAIEAFDAQIRSRAGDYLRRVSL
ncbi:MAG: 1-deoxy-D-xylulose-5-phosphate reductoisomerase [Bdellovibrionales bacterium]